MITEMKSFIVGCAISLACPGGLYDTHFASSDGIRVLAAFDSVLDSYRYRADLIAPLIAALHCDAAQPAQRRRSRAQACPQKKLGMLEIEVEASASIAAASERADMLDDAAAFHRFEIAEGQLSNALATLLAAIDHDRMLSANPDVARLRVAFSVAADDIRDTRKRYDEAAGRYNQTLGKFPASITHVLSRAYPRPLFCIPDQAPESLRARSDFGVLRGALRV